MFPFEAADNKIISDEEADADHLILMDRPAENWTDHMMTHMLEKKLGPHLEKQLEIYHEHCFKVILMMF